MIAAQLRVLDQADNGIQAAFSTLDGRPDTAEQRCEGVTAVTFAQETFPGRPGTQQCDIRGWTILCAKWLKNYETLSAKLIKKKIGSGCKSDTVVKALQRNTFDFNTLYGSGGRLFLCRLLA
jgi:hypothetical protein